MTSFQPKHVTHTYAQRILAPAAEVFPLLCPVREAEWLDGWDCELMYSVSGVAEEGCVFTSAEPDETRTIWLITQHDAENHHVQFAGVTPVSRVAKVDITLRDNGDDTTRASIVYSVTGLNEQGNRFVDAYTADSFSQGMRWWERSMNHYLTTGEKLKIEDAG